jgi:hypothetical protein
MKKETHQLKIDMPFDEAIQRLMRVSPKPSQKKTKSKKPKRK